jgi:hypothetical protein
VRTRAISRRVRSQGHGNPTHQEQIDMGIEFADTWLDDVRKTWWYNKFEAKDPSAETTSDGEYRWKYAEADGSATFANMAEEILAVNMPFLESFDQNAVWSALGSYAYDHSGDGDPNGAHCRALLSEEDGNTLKVEQGMHQPENEDDPNGGFMLHATVRLAATTVDADQSQVGAPRHVYMMQNDDGSLYVTDMT